MPARSMWQRYLSDQGDVGTEPAVHRMTGWIRRELTAAAARAGNFGRAHLLRLDLTPPERGTLPSLEDFVAEQGLDGFGEAEQQVLYAERHGTDLAAQRRRRTLLRRQLWAVHTLEAQLSQPVSQNDGCEVWFVDSLAQRLAANGIATLGALHARMRAAPDWWAGLRGIGVGKAQALTRFVAAHADTLGALPARCPADGPPGDLDATPAPAQAAAVSPLAPIERLVVPEALNGREGRFRAPPEACLLEADNDLQAIQAWLAAKAPMASHASDHAGEVRLTHTQLSYRKEAERFLLWAIFENLTALSSVAVEDCVRFRDFLLDPPAHWCGPRSVARWHAGWRPIEGRLSARSCGYAMSVLHNLFAFLVKQGYLRANPWPAVRPPVTPREGLDTGRALTAAQWQTVREVLDRLPRTPANRRLQVALRLLYETGIRLSELVGARAGDLEWLSLAQPPEAPEVGWWLTVLGKGGRLRRVPVSEAWIEQLGAYLTARGLPADPRRAPPGAFLLGSAAPGADATIGVSGNVFHTQLKAFFAHCAGQLAATDPQGAVRLRRASSHWLRHTNISHALDHGAPVEVVQQNAGHASLTTTTKYIKVADARRARAMRGLWEAR
nr:tyrosine-type recombinase/integrase [Cupriavidus sp. UME77]